MGLLIHISFETSEGFPVSSVYCRIKSVLYNSVGGGEYTVTMNPETHLSREARIAGKSPISTPGVPNYMSVHGTVGDMAYLYGLLKAELARGGLVAEDVIEPAPEPAPEPAAETPPEESGV